MRRKAPARRGFPPWDGVCGRWWRGVIASACLGVGFLAGGPAAAALPVGATLEFKDPPPGPVFGVGAPIALVLKLRTVTLDAVITGEGFGTQEYWRRLYFVDPLGRTVLNAAEASIHAENRVFQCLSRSHVLQATAIPVVPVEILPGTSAAQPFYREYTIDDATKFFDLSLPGRYTVNARIPLQAFAAGPDVVDDCDQFQGQTVLNVGAGTSAQGFVVESNALSFEVVNTGTGTNVAVQPVDATTGATPVTVTFGEVTAAGATSLVTSGSGPPLPANFSAGNPPVFYDLTTSAGFAPPVTVCVTYSQPAFGNESQLKLFHFESGAWADVTTSLDTVANLLCGQVTSLSPFAAAEGGNQPPVASAGTNQTVILGSHVALSGSASDPDNQPGPLTLLWTQLSGPVVTLNGATTLTPSFTASAVGTYVFSLTASDGAATSAPAIVTVSVQYRFSGFLPPLSGKSFALGSTIPVKFKLFDTRGVAVGTASARLAFVKPPATAPAVTGPFTFDRKQQQYEFDLKTKGLSTGVWRIDAILDDGTIHSIQVLLR